MQGGTVILQDCYMSRLCDGLLLKDVDASQICRATGSGCRRCGASRSDRAGHSACGGQPDVAAYHIRLSYNISSSHTRLQQHQLGWPGLGPERKLTRRWKLPCFPESQVHCLSCPS